MQISLQKVLIFLSIYIEIIMETKVKQSRFSKKKMVIRKKKKNSSFFTFVQTTTTVSRGRYNKLR